MVVLSQVIKLEEVTLTSVYFVILNVSSPDIATIHIRNITKMLQLCHSFQ